MPELETSIGPFDEDTRSVPVTFASGEIVHRRSINACLDAAGGYDVAATAERVADVARGVAVKIGLGVIVTPPEPEPVTPDSE